jgi:hypothetical protein
MRAMAMGGAGLLLMGTLAVGIGDGRVAGGEFATAGGPGAGTAGSSPKGSPTELVLIAPGTQVDKAPPPGWSHLIIKSIPRLASGDLDTLPGTASETATLFRTVILADVRPVGGRDGGRFVLRRIGLGLCVPVRGRDTVVTTRSLPELGVDLGFVERTVLGHAEQELRRGRLIARTSTFAVHSGPTLIRSGTAHREILLRYGVVVDPATGTLRTAIWEVDTDPARRIAARSMVLLPPSLVDDCEVDVIADKILGSVPVNWSFAMRGLPAGRPLPISGGLGAWSIREARTAAESVEFEAAFRLGLPDSLQATPIAR